MKLKIFILFLLVFAAIGQTIFLNIDAKSDFLEEKSTTTYTHSSENELSNPSVQSSEVVVTIRQHESEIANQDVSSDKKTTTISTPLKLKKPCSQEAKEERFICQKAKETSQHKQIRVAGSNHEKSSTIQNP